MSRVGEHTCWTIWGPSIIDHKGRLRQLTRIRRQVGEQRFRELRYSMQTAQARLKIWRLLREMYNASESAS
jgi:hypothetical protein